MSAPSSSLEVSIVIPIHNEEQMVEDTAHAVTLMGPRLGAAWELVLVENGSTDRTLELAQRLADANPRIRVMVSDRANYGAAVKTGLRAAQGAFAVVFDCDLYDEVFATSALNLLRADDRLAVVVASKTMAESSDERSMLRRAGSRVFTSFIRSLVGLSVSDTHGMKVFALSRIQRELAATRLEGHVFDTELIVRCERSGWKAGELPCTVREMRPARTGYLSRVPSAVADAWRLRRMLGTE